MLYTGSRLGAIQGIDGNGRVFYYGNLENTLGPHIRAGFLVVPANLTDAFLSLAARAGAVPDAYVLAAIASFIENNQYAMHVKKIRAVYARRMKLMAETCRLLLPEVQVGEPHGGFHLTLNLTSAHNAEQVSLTAAKQGLAVEPLSKFFLKNPGQNSIVIGFGMIPDRLIEAAIRRLASILREEPAEIRGKSQ